MKKGMISLNSGILEGSGDLRVRVFAPVGRELPRAHFRASCSRGEEGTNHYHGEGRKKGFRV